MSGRMRSCWSGVPQRAARVMARSVGHSWPKIHRAPGWFRERSSCGPEAETQRLRAPADGRPVAHPVLIELDLAQPTEHLFEPDADLQPSQVRAQAAVGA